ncbi:phosphatase PAP2 family protein [Piscirickettsia salmonis]|uniref:phosphatase PAP2 family protein n=1 Tax=Piscirickettsia salmonis TaxID=1238 RepID=UPI0007D7F86A|nr:PAP2 superfamily protein [Piscirickettsiaceae bacterium NZ-RLO1]
MVSAAMEVSLKFDLLKIGGFGQETDTAFNIFDKLSIGLSLLLIFLSFLFLFINDNYTHYVSDGNPININNGVLVLLVFLLLALSAILYRSLPKAGFVFKFIALYFLSIMAMIISYNVQFSPFPAIDVDLHKIDLLMGFNQDQWLASLYLHPLCLKILNLAYESLTYQIIFLPVFACYFVDRIEIESFLVKLCFLNIIGCLIYYFWPTASPASVLNHKYLIDSQINLALKFKQLHQKIYPTVSGGGLISFPSFHVIWSALLTLLFRKKIYFLVPLLLLNSLLWLATVLLGWHYIMDVVAGLVLVILSFILFDKIIKNKFILKNNFKQ